MGLRKRIVKSLSKSANKHTTAAQRLKAASVADSDAAVRAGKQDAAKMRTFDQNAAQLKSMSDWHAKKAKHRQNWINRLSPKNKKA